MLNAVILPLGLLAPYFVKIIIDRPYAAKDLKSFVVLASVGVFILILITAVNAIIEYQQRYVRYKINFNLSQDAFRHIQGFPLGFFREQSTGEYLYKISYDIEKTAEFVSGIIPQGLFLFPRLFFIVAIIFYLNGELALLVLCLMAAVYLNFYLFGHKIKELSREIVEQHQGIFKGLQEVFSRISLVKVFGREDYESGRISQRFSQKLKAELKEAKVETVSTLFGSFTTMQFVLIAIILYGGYQLVKGVTTFGSLAAIMLYLSQIGDLQRRSESFLKGIIINSVSCQRLAEIMDTRPKSKEAIDAAEYRLTRGEIEFKDILFGYQENRAIFKGISFIFTANSKIALVGPSGCGKTTLLSLILRLYIPQRGAIFIDGYDISKIKPESLRKQSGIALQEPFLWNDTIQNNILYGKINASFEEVVWAAKTAEADDFIRRLPEGYETVIGENACKISEGQKERIAIARAVIKKPKILMLDEAMASLDSQIEDKIIDNIKREFPDSTLIVVSHRLSTITQVDAVYFLQGPDKISIGSHNELSLKNPRYKALFSRQIEERPTDIIKINA